jgi:hypothetical protein
MWAYVGLMVQSSVEYVLVNENKITIGLSGKMASMAGL